jgi:hypothetical protein
MNPPEMSVLALFPDPNTCTVDEMFACFTGLEERFREAHDERAVFLGAYAIITGAMRHAIDRNEFDDDTWVRQYLLQFARLYLAALRASAEGQETRVPTAWRIAFELANSGRGTVLQHLLLGINAHINHDLALALVEAGLEPERERRYKDHTAVNRVLQAATQDLETHVERFYSPALYLIDVLCGPFEREIADLIVDRARETAWQHGLALANAPDEEARAALRRQIDHHAGALAEIIARPYTAPFEFIEILKTQF